MGGRVGVVFVIVFYFVLCCFYLFIYFFFSSRRRHTRLVSDWSSDVCSSDITGNTHPGPHGHRVRVFVSGHHPRGVIRKPLAEARASAALQCPKSAGWVRNRG